MAGRFSGEGGPFHTFAEIRSDGAHWTGKVELVEEKLMEPLRWRKPRRVFVNSMSDLFHENLETWAIHRVFRVMALTPHITYQVLTKRASRMRDVMQASPWGQAPLPNVWLGVSVENQEYADKRIPDLLATPAAVRFVSYEPALGAVDWKPYFAKPGIHWVIVGGESGPSARPFDVTWARQTVKQCRKGGVPVFVKQLGANPQEIAYPRDVQAREVSDWQRDGWTWIVDGQTWISEQALSHWRKYYRLKDRKGGAMDEWPEDLRVREFPGGEK